MGEPERFKVKTRSSRNNLFLKGGGENRENIGTPRTFGKRRPNIKGLQWRTIKRLHIFGGKRRGRNREEPLPAEKRLPSLRGLRFREVEITCQAEERGSYRRRLKRIQKGAGRKGLT